MNGSDCVRIGVISDTHGVFRPEIASLFSGVTHIFHAGDIGKPAVLRQLQSIAPTTAVLGNIDIPAWFPDLSKTEIITICGLTVLILHDLDALVLDPVAAGINVVISGHTHFPASKTLRNVLYINPGSAGPARLKSRPCVALLSVGNDLSVTFHQL